MYNDEFVWGIKCQSKSCSRSIFASHHQAVSRKKNCIAKQKNNIKG